MQPKVSVIVPTYNGGAFIKPCLESLRCQTLREIEFVLILDCPTDGSDRVAEEFAAIDNRFVIVKNSENMHIGCSRNRGLSVARGEYIGFCDNDDYCDPAMFEKLYRRAKETDVDVVLSNQCSRFDDKDEVYPVPEQEGFNVVEATRTIISTAVMKQDQPSYANIRSVWNQLFRADFIRKHGLQFVDTRQVCNEDTMFCAEVYLKNPRVAVVNETVYFWLQHQTSTLHSYSYTRTENAINYVTRLYGILKREHRWTEMQEAFAECLVRKLYTAFRGELRRYGMKKGLSEFRRKKNADILLSEAIDSIREVDRSFLPPTKRLFWRLLLNQ